MEISTASTKNFRAKLYGGGPGEAWTFITVPFNVERTWGSRARVSVVGTINGFEFRSSVFPDGEGHHTLMVNKDMQQAANVRPGQIAAFSLSVDSKPRTIEIPADVKNALEENPTAKRQFERFAPSHRKRYVEWITSAKREETRTVRVAKAISLIADGKTMM